MCEYVAMTDRWDRLFDDVAANVEAESAHERLGEHSELVVEAFAEKSLAERIAGAQGQTITVWSERRGITGVVERCGRDWVVLSQGAEVVLVMLEHVELVRMESRTHSEPGMMSAMSVLRNWVRERLAVRIEFAGGFVEGYLEAVASDYLHMRAGKEFDLVPLRSVRAVRVIS